MRSSAEATDDPHFPVEESDSPVADCCRQAATYAKMQRSNALTQ
jgi:hypothetical protein